MPNPTNNDVHVSSALRDFVVANLQEDASFVAMQATPIKPVDKQFDQYHVWATGSLNRNDMLPRGPGETVKRFPMTVSQSPYHCVVKACGAGISSQTAANADMALDPIVQAYLEGQIKIELERQWQAAYFAASIWSTDWTGQSTSPSTNQFLQFDVSTSDPQADIYALAEVVRGKCGRTPNTIVAGPTTHATLMGNPQIRDSIKYTGVATANTISNAMAALLGVEKYLVGRGFYNSAADGQTASLASAITADGLWIGYVSDLRGEQSYSATQAFGWNQGGQSTGGIGIYSWDDPATRQAVSEAEVAMDFVVTAADAGAFMADCVG